jgi:hypothetical protein
MKHNIVIIDYKVNYDQEFFWLLKQETRSRTARDSRRRRLFPGYMKASNEILSFQRYSRMHVAGKVFGIDLLGEEIGEALNSKLLRAYIESYGQHYTKISRSRTDVRPTAHSRHRCPVTLSHSVRHAPRRTSRSRVAASLCVLIRVTTLLGQHRAHALIYGAVLWPELLWRTLEVMVCNLRVRGRRSWADPQRLPTSAGECSSPQPALCRRVPP